MAKLFDTEALESTFKVKTFKRKKSSSVSSKSPAKPARKAKIQLVDGRRATNCVIALARFRLPHEAIRNAIVSVDDSILSEERLEQLCKIAPTQEELDAVGSFDGDVAQLGEAEKFYTSLLKVPRISHRLSSMLFRATFPATSSDIEDKLTLLGTTIHKIKNSQHLRLLLQMVLEIGNHLNHGKSRAVGFKLDTLAKLESLKSSSNAISLLDFVADTVVKLHNEVSDLESELKGVDECARLDLSHLETLVGQAEGQVRKISNELKHTDPEDDSDRFQTIFSAFHAEAKGRVGQMRQSLVGVSEGTIGLAVYFGEDSSLPSQELFGMLAKFLASFTKAVKRAKRRSLQKKQGDVKQKTKIDASYSKPQPLVLPIVPATSKKGKQTAKAKEGVVDQALQGISGGDSTEISKQIRLRRALRANLPPLVE